MVQDVAFVLQRSSVTVTRHLEVQSRQTRVVGAVRTMSQLSLVTDLMRTDR